MLLIKVLLIKEKACNLIYFYAWYRGFGGVGGCMIVSIHHIRPVSTNVGFLRLDGVCLSSRGYN